MMTGGNPLNPNGDRESGHTALRDVTTIGRWTVNGANVEGRERGFLLEQCCPKTFDARVFEKK
jgi:hypothetical protein